MHWRPSAPIHDRQLVLHGELVTRGPLSPGDTGIFTVAGFKEQLHGPHLAEVPKANVAQPSKAVGMSGESLLTDLSAS